MHHSREPRVSAWLCGTGQLSTAERLNSRGCWKGYSSSHLLSEADAPDCHRREQERREATADLLDARKT